VTKDQPGTSQQLIRNLSASDQGPLTENKTSQDRQENSQQRPGTSQQVTKDFSTSD